VFLTCDNTIYLWAWDHADLVKFSTKQIIVAAGLVRPDPKIFHTETLPYLLVLATRSEVILLGVRFHQPNNFLSPISLVECGLPASPADGAVVSCVAGHDSGRVFLGCTDGSIKELVVDTPWFGLSAQRRCFLRERDGVGLKGLVGIKAPRVASLVVDSERHMLYAVGATGVVTLFDLGPQGLSFRRVATCKLYAHNPKTEVPNLVCLSVVPMADSNHVHAVAVLANGTRVYFTTGDEFHRVAHAAAIASASAHRSAAGAGLNAHDVELAAADAASAALSAGRSRSRFPPASFVAVCTSPPAASGVVQKAAVCGDTTLLHCSESDTLFCAVSEAASLRLCTAVERIQGVSRVSAVAALPTPLGAPRKFVLLCADGIVTLHQRRSADLLLKHLAHGGNLTAVREHAARHGSVRTAQLLTELATSAPPTQAARAALLRLAASADAAMPANMLCPAIIGLRRYIAHTASPITSGTLFVSSAAAPLALRCPRHVLEEADGPLARLAALADAVSQTVPLRPIDRQAAQTTAIAIRGLLQVARLLVCADKAGLDKIAASLPPSASSSVAALDALEAQQPLPVLSAVALAAARILGPAAAEALAADCPLYYTPATEALRNALDLLSSGPACSAQAVAAARDCVLPYVKELGPDALRELSDALCSAGAVVDAVTLVTAHAGAAVDPVPSLQLAEALVRRHVIDVPAPGASPAALAVLAAVWACPETALQAAVLAMLLAAGIKDAIISASCPIAVEWVSENAPELLWRWHAQRGQDAEAAIALERLAHAPGVDLEERNERLSMAVACAHRSGLSDLLRSLSDEVDVAAAQLALLDEARAEADAARSRGVTEAPVEVLAATVAALQASLLPVSPLYNDHAVPCGLHLGALRLLHVAGLADPVRAASHWQGLICRELPRYGKDGAAAVLSLAAELAASSPVPLTAIFALLEASAADWAPGAIGELATASALSRPDVLSAYAELLSSGSVFVDFSLSVAHLTASVIALSRAALSATDVTFSRRPQAAAAYAALQAAEVALGASPDEDQTAMPVIVSLLQECML
jgi:hypothetical protein